MGIKGRVFVFQADHQSDGNLVIVEPVNESTPEFLHVQGITHGMVYLTGLDVSFRNAPYLLAGQGKNLAVFVFVQLVFLYELFGQWAPGSFRENGKFRFYPGTRLKVLQLFSMMVDPGIDGFGTNNFPCLVQYFINREAGINLHPLLPGTGKSGPGRLYNYPCCSCKEHESAV